MLIRLPKGCSIPQVQCVQLQLAVVRRDVGDAHVRHRHRAKQAVVKMLRCPLWRDACRQEPPLRGQRQGWDARRPRRLNLRRQLRRQREQFGAGVSGWNVTIGPT